LLKSCYKVVKKFAKSCQKVNKILKRVGGEEGEAEEEGDL
jgi:hypothetical protein